VQKSEPIEIAPKGYTNKLQSPYFLKLLVDSSAHLDYWYGSNFLTDFTLEASAITLERKRLFRFLSFFVRIWEVYAWERLTLPFFVILKRFFAPLCVFNLGITKSSFNFK